MKKTFVILIAMLFFTTYSAFAQWSVKVDGEYMFPLGQSQLDPNLGINTFTNSPVDVGPLSGTYGSLGKGLAFGIAVDYTFKSNITLELGGRYWHGVTYNFNDSSINSGLISAALSEQLSLFIISPSLIYKIKTNSKFTPYMGIGMDVVFGEKVDETETNVFNLGFFNSGSAGLTSTSTYKSSATFLPAIGFNGQLGISYSLSQRFSVSLGFRFDAFSLMPDKLILNSEVNNGSSVDLSNQPIADKETDYVKTLPANANTNSNQPGEVIAQSTTTSTWGITIGVEFKFGSKNK